MVRRRKNSPPDQPSRFDEDRKDVGASRRELRPLFFGVIFGVHFGRTGQSMALTRRGRRAIGFDATSGNRILPVKKPGLIGWMELLSAISFM